MVADVEYEPCAEELRLWVGDRRLARSLDPPVPGRTPPVALAYPLPSVKVCFVSVLYFCPKAPVEVLVFKFLSLKLPAWDSVGSEPFEARISVESVPCDF